MDVVTLFFYKVSISKTILLICFSFGCMSLLFNPHIIFFTALQRYYCVLYLMKSNQNKETNIFHLFELFYLDYGIYFFIKGII